MSEQTQVVPLTSNTRRQNDAGENAASGGPTAGLPDGDYLTVMTVVTVDTANPQTVPTLSLRNLGPDNDIPIATWNSSTNRYVPLPGLEGKTLAQIRTEHPGTLFHGVTSYDNTTIAQLLVNNDDGTGNATTLNQNIVQIYQDNLTIEQQREFGENFLPLAQDLASREYATTNVPIDLTIADADDVVRRDYGETVYPLSMRATTQDRLEITMYRYEGRTIGGDTGSGPGGSSGVSGFTLGTRDFTERLGSVQLPIHPGIRDNNGVDWGGASLNPLQAYLATAATAVVGAEDTTQEIANQTNRAANTLRFAMGDKSVGKAMTLWFAQKAIGTQNLLSRASGAIVNPNLELLFNGPLLRDFTFNFRLSARTQGESIAIKRIIRFFKQGGSVKSGGGEGIRGVFLKAPNVFKIRYLTYQSGAPVDHPSINRIKMAALLGCEVDYTPDNTYMTYDDNDQDHPMTSYNLGLRFSELTPILEDDYYNTNYTTETESLSQNSIGY